jgi:hypothetical protein
MSQVSLVALDDLGRRLRRMLGHDSLVARRFDRALHRQDEVAIAAALDALRLYPVEERERVEAVLTEWLLACADTAEPGERALS